ncbi:lipopolysaccharide biosynthesis protein [uncultured Ilyobacter sp.]|uniref:lipopolysaccharide biosynthesis protein n=1 Tax=uncultured Ilyobacter sp. TaxID=544433 RepID=UPI0029C95004|nr:lipopolysaccharide biosynthesis protein [uncultured Ilyobacter sp.]
MVSNTLSKKALDATKWSSLTEFIAKLIVPVTNIILARVLTPNAFGVVASVTLIISFADMISDSGFQKFLIQKEFSSPEKKIKFINVAFWSNFILSLVLWSVLCVYRNIFADILGNSNLGTIIVIAGASLPLTSFSSIQIAVFRRSFDYKTLFKIRVIEVFSSFVVTVPLALLGFKHWSIIYGILFRDLVKAVLLTMKSSWKPKLYYSIVILKEMLTFSLWSLIESLTIWLTSYVGTFILANTLSDYYLGLYKTTIITVNGIFSIITLSTTSILFTALSRVQNDEVQFKSYYYNFINYTSMIILPLGIGTYVYRDFITEILLGSQWKEASTFLGIWALMSCITIILGQYCSEIYRSKGMPKISVLVQVFHLIALIPTLLIFSKHDFSTLIYARSLIKAQQILVNLIAIYYLFNFSPFRILNIIYPYIKCSILMGIVGHYLRALKMGYLWEIISILLCMLLYLVLLISNSKSRRSVFQVCKSFNWLHKKLEKNHYYKNINSENKCDSTVS